MATKSRGNGTYEASHEAHCDNKETAVGQYKLSVAAKSGEVYQQRKNKVSSLVWTRKNQHVNGEE